MLTRSPARRPRRLSAYHAVPCAHSIIPSFHLPFMQSRMYGVPAPHRHPLPPTHTPHPSPPLLQVLPLRTHPTMNMNHGGGFLLSGTVLAPPQQQQQQQAADQQPQQQPQQEAKQEAKQAQQAPEQQGQQEAAEQQQQQQQPMQTEQAQGEQQ